MNRQARETIDALTRVLPRPWKARLEMMSSDSIEVYHPGPRGGGVLLRWGRHVVLVAPNHDDNGVSLGPCADTEERGEFRGRGWRQRLVSEVMTTIGEFDRRYPR
jgi:hypothetical protein